MARSELSIQAAGVLRLAELILDDGSAMFLSPLDVEAVVPHGKVKLNADRGVANLSRIYFRVGNICCCVIVQGTPVDVLAWLVAVGEGQDDE